MTNLRRERKREKSGSKRRKKKDRFPIWGLVWAEAGVWNDHILTQKAEKASYGKGLPEGPHLSKTYKATGIPPVLGWASDARQQLVESALAQTLPGLGQVWLKRLQLSPWTTGTFQLVHRGWKISDTGLSPKVWLLVRTLILYHLQSLVKMGMVRSLSPSLPSLFFSVLLFFPPTSPFLYHGG